ncbi:hypothetical protein S83_053851, partial [Arachis hypogaea]
MNRICLRGKEIFVGEAKFRRNASKEETGLGSDGMRRGADTTVGDRGNVPDKGEDHMVEG